jgi:hypothetical protein
MQKAWEAETAGGENQEGTNAIVGFSCWKCQARFAAGSDSKLWCWKSAALGGGHALPGNKSCMPAFDALILVANTFPDLGLRKQLLQSPQLVVAYGIRKPNSLNRPVA